MGIVPVKSLLLTGCLIALLCAGVLYAQAPAPGAAQAAETQDLARMEQALKEAHELQATQPQAVPEKLAPLLAELRQLQQNGSVTAAQHRIFQDALLVLMRTQAMLLQSEQEVMASLRELLVVNPKIDEGIFNPREKLLVDKVRSAEIGRLSLQTTPPGIPLGYMGMELGVTPLDIPLMAGTYRLQLRKQGYLDQDFTVTIGPGEMLSAVRPLQRRVVEVPISTNAPSASVSLNGQPVGVSQGYEAWIASLPADKQQEWGSIVKEWNVDLATSTFIRIPEVPVGEAVTLEFKAPCYEPLSMPLTIPEQEVNWTRPIAVRPELRHVELKRDIGFMEVSSVPQGAEVWLDGVLLGKTPLSRDVCAGSHRVQVLNRSGQYVRKVIIQRGQTTKLGGDLKPALAFLGVYARNPQTNALDPTKPDWESVARTLSQRVTAFTDPQLSVDEIEALRKKGNLPVDRLLEGAPVTPDTDLLVKRIAAEVGRVDLILAALRSGDKYTFRLYCTIHPAPDLIESANLQDASLDFIVSQLNKAENVGARLRVPDIGVDFMELPKGLAVLSVSQAAASAKTALAAGVMVQAVDQKSMTLKELRSYLRTRKPGQSVTLEAAPRNESVQMIPVTVRLAGVEYPWSTPDGFTNSVLAMLQNLVERDPLSDDAKYAGLNLARGLMNQGEWKLALEHLAKTNLEPHKSGICPGTVLYYQGRCYEELGDRALAEGYYSRVKDYPEATLGTPGGLEAAVLAERRIQALKNSSR